MFDWINNAPDTHLFLLDEAYFDMLKPTLGIKVD
jgi:hypothetical protein